MNITHPLIEISPATFEGQVRQSHHPVLIVVTDGTHGQTESMPPLEEMISLYGRRAVFARLNLDQFPELADQLGIASAPALLLYQSGDLTYQFLGHWTHRDLTDMLGRLALDGHGASHQTAVLRMTTACRDQNRPSVSAP